VKEFLSVPTMQRAYLLYLSLLDLDFARHFTCQICRQQPNVLIADGTAISFGRDKVKCAPFKPDASLPAVHRGTSYHDRVIIDDSLARTLMMRFAGVLI